MQLTSSSYIYLIYIDNQPVSNVLQQSLQHVSTFLKLCECPAVPAFGGELLLVMQSSVGESLADHPQNLVVLVGGKLGIPLNVSTGFLKWCLKFGKPDTLGVLVKVSP